MTDIKDTIKRTLELAEAATLGPVESHNRQCFGSGFEVIAGDNGSDKPYGFSLAAGLRQKDAEYVALIWTAAPELARECDRLEHNGEQRRLALVACTNERDEALAKVAVLEAAARKVCFEPVGNRRATCNADALRALDALVPDQRGEGES